MATKLDEVFVSFTESLEDLSRTILKDSSNFEFESSFNHLIRDFGQSVSQSVVGNKPKSKNERDTIHTSIGNFCFPKSHSLAISLSGFKISSAFMHFIFLFYSAFLGQTVGYFLHPGFKAQAEKLIHRTFFQFSCVAFYFERAVSNSDAG